jgi:acyl carrier protein
MPFGDGNIRLAEGADADPVLLVSSGSVDPSMELKIIGATDRKECGELEEGEICIAGNCVTEGYWNKDNSETFHDVGGTKFLRTGDLGFIYRGHLFVHGRIKEMLIVRGVNVYPYDIELEVSKSNMAIEANGVAAFMRNNDQEELVVVVEVRRTYIKEASVEHIIRDIDAAVTRSAGINAFDIVLAPPFSITRTTSGKLQRVKCQADYEENIFNAIGSKRSMAKTFRKRERSAILLNTAIEKADYSSIRTYILNVIESKIESFQGGALEDVDALSDIGIDSLQAMEMVNIFNKDLGLDLNAANFFQHNTLGELTRIIENILWLKGKQPSGKELII